MDQIPLSIHYDADMDIFSAWVRQPKEVVCLEPVEGVVLRLDAQTDEFVGYTVLDFSRRFAGRTADAAALPLVPEFALRPLKKHLQMLQEEAISVS